MPIAIYASSSYKRERERINSLREGVGKSKAAAFGGEGKMAGMEKVEGRRNENIVSIDTGKTRSYVVVEEHGKTTREGYTETSKEGFAEVIYAS